MDIWLLRILNDLQRNLRQVCEQVTASCASHTTARVTHVEQERSLRDHPAPEVRIHCSVEKLHNGKGAGSQTL